MARGFSVSLLAGALALAPSIPTLAQIGAAPLASGAMAGPDYDSGIQAGPLSDSNFNTPEADGRPGVYYFELGSKAFRDKDYRHAVDMFKVAASWAYKPAEYDLALMYFRGEGVSVDRVRGAAWMILAAERNQPQYVNARNVMVTLLSNAEFAKTDELWRELKSTYGDEIALRRAKAQWAWVRTHQTGTRVGGAVGELFVGAFDKPTYKGGNPSGRAQGLEEGWGYLPGGSVDGAIAYREFEQSDNPYDPFFQKNMMGTATVGPLAPVKASDAASQKQQGGKGHNF